jgi:hypothetical protein
MSNNASMQNVSCQYQLQASEKKYTQVRISVSVVFFVVYLTTLFHRLGLQSIELSVQV